MHNSQGRPSSRPAPEGECSQILSKLCYNIYITLSQGLRGVHTDTPTRIHTYVHKNADVRKEAISGNQEARGGCIKVAYMHIRTYE